MRNRHTERQFTVFVGQLGLERSATDADIKELIGYLNQELPKDGIKGVVKPLARSEIKTKDLHHVLSATADLITIAGLVLWTLPGSIKKKVTPEYFITKAREWSPKKQVRRSKK